MYKIQDNYIFNEKYYLKSLVRNTEGAVKYVDFYSAGFNIIDNVKKDLGQKIDINLFTFQNKRNKNIIFDYFLTFKPLPKYFSYSKLFIKCLDSHFETRIENRINLLNPVKGGFIAYYNGIKAFIPKTHVSKMLKTIKTKKNTSLSTQIFFANLHKHNLLLFPKLTGLMGKPSLISARIKYRKFQKRVTRLKPSFVILYKKNEYKKQTVKNSFVRRNRNQKIA